MTLLRCAGLALGALLALTTPALAAPPTTAAPAGPARRLDGIAAVVNDEVVLQSDVEEQLGLFLSRSQVRPDSALVDTLRKQILNQLIDEKLIVAEARRQGVTVPDAEISRKVEQAIQEAKERLGGEEGFRAQLARENMTEGKLRDKYKTDLERQTLAERLLRKQIPEERPVTQAEAEAYFKAHADKIPRMPAKVRISVIQIPVTPDSVAAAKGKAAALAVRKRILAGEKFAKVAAEVSEDAGSARSGGDLGFFSRGAMDPEFEKAAFTAKLNTLTPPVRTAFGWHIIEVLERDTVKTPAGRDSLDRNGQPLAEAHVRHILIRVPLTDADSERARRLAERVRGEAQKGTDFATLVRRYSKYEGQQDEGGDVGFVALNSLQESIRAGLDSLETGQISEVLANAAGYNIFRVTDRVAERAYTLEEIKDDLPELVGQLKQRDRYDEWMKSLRAKSHVEIRG